MSITDKQPGKKPDRGTLTLSRVAVNQRGEDVMESIWQLVVRTRAGAA
jgi:acyl dehydratase